MTRRETEAQRAAARRNLAKARAHRKPETEKQREAARRRRERTAVLRRPRNAPPHGGTWRRHAAPVTTTPAGDGEATARRQPAPRRLCPIEGDTVTTYTYCGDGPRTFAVPTPDGGTLHCEPGDTIDLHDLPDGLRPFFTGGETPKPEATPAPSESSAPPEPAPEVPPPAPAPEAPPAPAPEPQE